MSSVAADGEYKAGIEGSVSVRCRANTCWIIDDYSLRIIHVLTVLMI